MDASRIRSAPITARLATSERSVSLARLTSWATSACAALRMRSRSDSASDAGVVHHLRGLAPGVVDDGPRLGAGLVENLFRAGFRVFQIPLRLRCRLQTVGDGLLAFAHGPDQERPDESPAEDHEDGEGNRLPNKST